MFDSVAYIGDIYVGMEGWVLSLPPCSSPSSQISSASPAWMSCCCGGNEALWYFTPHLNQWPLYLTTPGNYLAGRLDHVNSRPTSWGREGGREWRRWRESEGINRKQIKAEGRNKTHKQKISEFVCLLVFLKRRPGRDGLNNASVLFLVYSL